METIQIWNLKITIIDYSELIQKIVSSIKNNSKTLITYANAHTLNLIYKNTKLIEKLNRFDVVHPDGIGIFIASKFLFKKFGIKKRMTGSDFYNILIGVCIEKNYSLFFFGHDEKTLNKIYNNIPDLNIVGSNPGYNYNEIELINKINKNNPDILIVGLGFPNQEEWILDNSEKLNCKTIIAVGDGIKVFSGTKRRGPLVFQKIGLEWFIRLLTNPLKYWKRYTLGNYLFLVRIIKTKFN